MKKSKIAIEKVKKYLKLIKKEKRKLSQKCDNHY
jgi:hypothetical protein